MPKQTCIYYPICPIKRFYQQGKIDKKWVQNYCFKNGRHCVRKKLEQAGQSHPDNMLPNGDIDPSLV